MDDYDLQDYDDDNDSFYSYDADNSGNGGFYNPVRDEENFSIRPDFLKRSENGAVDDQASTNRDRNNIAKKDLKNSENAAAKSGDNNGKKKGDDKGSAVGGARMLEKGAAVANPTAGIINSVKGKKNDKNKKGGFKKKAASIVLILSIFGGGAGIASVGQMFQPFAYVTNVIQNFDVSSYSSAARLRTTMKALFKGTKVSAKLTNSLGNVGIETEADADGNLTKLKYDSNDGSTKTISSEAELDSALKNDKTFSGKTAKAANDINNDSFFGKVKSYAMDRINALRNRWNGYNDEDDANGSGQKFNAIASGEEAESGAGKTTIKTADEQGETDDDGNAKGAGVYKSNDENPETVDKKNTLDGMLKVEEDSGGEVKITSDKLDLGGISKIAKRASFVHCTYVLVTQAIAAITIARQVMDMINGGSGYAEAVQKCQVGEGGECAAMHGYSNKTNSGDFWQATTIHSVMGAGTQNNTAGDANLENIFNNKTITSIVTKAGIAIDKWRECVYMKMISAGLDFASDLFDVVKTIATGGLYGIVLIVKKFIVGTAVSLAVSAVVGEAVKMMIKVGVNIMSFDRIKDIGTKLAGNYFTGGMKRMLYSAAQANGAAMGTTTAVNMFNEYKNSVIADRMIYDQENLSPFDITSKYTFLGSIVNSMAKFSILSSATTTPLISSMSSVGSLVASSVTSMMPKAMAVEYNDVADAPGDCWLVNSIDAVGDANLCFESIISDTSTFSISYEESKDYLCENRMLKNCDTDQPTISSGSTLAKYIEYWTMRDTHPGLADSAIVDASHKVSTGDKTVDGVISRVPIIGSVADFANASGEEQNETEIFGSHYVAGSENWGEEEKNIQTFLEFDTLYEQLGLIETSTLASYLDDYYEKNPLDNSYEGTLARFSGLPKETVIDTLAYMEYLEFVEEYEPGARYAFGDDAIDEHIMLDENEDNFEYLPAIEIAYFDLRSRNYTV